jgi:hypothetical protein
VIVYNLTNEKKGTLPAKVRNGLCFYDFKKRSQEMSDISQQNKREKTAISEMRKEQLLQY